MEYTIRLAKPGDETIIGQLLVSIHAQHAEGRPDLFGKGCSKHSPSQIAASFGREKEPILVAADAEDRVLGYAMCLVKENTNPTQGPYSTFYIDDLNVAPAARRQGVGSALLSACRTLAKTKGCYNLTLNVWAFNEGAIAFYEKNGFSAQRLILERLV